MKSAFQQHILKILAQAASATVQTTVAGSPSNFDPYQFFPTMMVAWGANNVSAIRQLSNILNNTLYVLSNGALDMNRLRGNNFVVDTSKYADVVLKGIINFTLQIYHQLFSNNGSAFTGAINDKQQRIQNLKNSLVSFKIPDGGINNFLISKIGGNLKPIILNLLSLIK